jgi:transposase
MNIQTKTLSVRGSFSEDSRGRWYFNICVQVETAPTAGTTTVGIDLGLKDYVTP